MSLTPREADGCPTCEALRKQPPERDPQPIKSEELGQRTVVGARTFRVLDVITRTSSWTRHWYEPIEDEL